MALEIIFDWPDACELPAFHRRFLARFYELDAIQSLSRYRHEL
jgi:hypothetical protein